MFVLWVTPVMWGFILVMALAAAAVMTYKLRTSDHQDARMRTGPQRRQLMAKHAMDVLPGLKHEPRYVATASGRMMYTQHFEPTSMPVRGVLCYCHGYTENVSWTAAQNAQHLCLATGMATCLIDFHGHGRSDGLSTLVTDFQELVEDCCAYFRSMQPRFGNVPLFLYGNSMGGAVALHASLNHPGVFAGAVLVAPMVKIADEIRPKEPVLSGVIYLSHLLPWAAVTPTPDLLDLCVRDPVKKKHILRNPLRFTARGRLATARECYMATVQLEERFSEIVIPFLVLHGACDQVTAPEASRLLHKMASSSDKTIKVYPDKLHALTTGEPDDSVAEVMHDMATWLNARLGKGLQAV